MVCQPKLPLTFIGELINIKFLHIGLIEISTYVFFIFEFWGIVWGIVWGITVRFYFLFALSVWLQDNEAGTY